MDKTRLFYQASSVILYCLLVQGVLGGGDDFYGLCQLSTKMQFDTRTLQLFATGLIITLVLSSVSFYFKIGLGWDLVIAWALFFYIAFVKVFFFCYEESDIRWQSLFFRTASVILVIPYVFIVGELFDLVSKKRENSK